MDLQLLSFDEIGLAPTGSGIYAWYYDPLLPDSEIDNAIGRITGALSPAEKRHEAKRFLETHVFRHFQESPYIVEIAGPLKPYYSGPVPYIAPTDVTDDLIDRIAAFPQILPALKRALVQSVPHFARPIYIGLSDALRQRLQRHKYLIQTYRETAPPPDGFSEGAEADSGDHSFAKEVALKRNFFPDNLRVAAMPLVASGLGKEEARALLVAAEHILNRINFPLCGRN